MENGIGTVDFTFVVMLSLTHLVPLREYPSLQAVHSVSEMHLLHSDAQSKQVRGVL
jgi:hypothetical protein